MTKKKTEAPAANYVVGRPWFPGTDNPMICTYTHHGFEVHFGTMAEAIGLRDYCNRQVPKEKYRIYQIVEVPGSEDFTKDDI